MQGEAIWEFTWSDAYATGNKTVDEQHKTIFYIANTFIDAHLKGESKEILEEMLNFLVRYTTEHFLYEQELMIKTNYNDYENHKKYHDNFKLIIEKLKKEYDEGGASDELAKTLCSTIIKWLIQHIQREDFKFVKQYGKRYKIQ